MDKKKLLITGFEPFGGLSKNPSWEAVSKMPDRVGSFSLIKLKLPVEFGKAAERVISKAQELLPDVILCTGVATGRDVICFEKVAVNIKTAAIPDNSGFKPLDEAVVENGQAAYFATVPVRKMADAVKAKGIPAKISYSAGVYVCNDLFYNLLYTFSGTNTQVGFVHIPCTPELTKDGTSGIPLDKIISALETAISVM